MRVRKSHIWKSMFLSPFVSSLFRKDVISTWSPKSCFSW